MIKNLGKNFLVKITRFQINRETGCSLRRGENKKKITGGVIWDGTIIIF